MLAKLEEARKLQEARKASGALAKLTIAGNIEDARLSLGRWLGLCRPLVLDEEECGFGGFRHAHLTIAIPRSFENEAASALVEWANDDASGLLFCDSELDLPWPDDDA